ncbi:MAG TPA: type VI secretion system tube protein Hcp [Gemmatimonadaceae bacterium]|nr:type VI secretion system tube protein Hcp [Gemmatimonadaceae bacterium]
MAVDMFLKIDAIDGESTDDKHKGEIEVLSYSWGITQQKSASASSAGSLSAQRASFNDFHIVKAIDKTSPKLALACADGTHIKSIRLELCRAGGDKQPYMEYKFTDVLVTSFRPGGSGHGEALPLEEVSFTYGKAEWKYTQTKVEGGKAAGNVAGGWDLKSNKKV